MIYITADIHGGTSEKDLSKINSKRTRFIKEKDYLIICGDFGFIWYLKGSKKYSSDRKWLKWFAEKPYTTLFIDGNHENFDMLNKYPVTEWNGGKVHKINDKVYHLMRGQVFEIEGKTFFTMGGATSTDKENRREGNNWWRQEMPNYGEMNEGVVNLGRYHNKVDYILTHTAPTGIAQQVVETFYTELIKDSLTHYFDFIQENTEFKHWYFGHFHTDLTIDDKYTCIYNKILKIQ